jgi:hypothetical protein
VVSIDYAMAPFGPEIIEAYARLFPGDADKSPEILAWRFCDNPHGPGMFAVARADGIIQGMIALVPTDLVARGRTVSGFQAIDTIVNPQMQGKFVFVRLGRLVEDFVAGHSAVLWGFPNAAAARGWFGRLGWTRTGSVPFLIRPLRTGYLFRRFVPALGWIDVPLFRNRRKPCSDHNPAIDERYQHLWDHYRETPAVSVERSRAWARWRLHKPGAGYQWRYDGDYRSFVATRTLKKHGGVVAYVMEALTGPDRGAALTELLRHEMARLGQSAGAEVALAWCDPRSPNYFCFRAAGFLPFPDKFRPAEIHHGYWRDAAQDTAFPAQSPWYLSYLDSDTV